MVELTDKFIEEGFEKGSIHIDNLIDYIKVVKKIKTSNCMEKRATLSSFKTEKYIYEKCIEYVKKIEYDIDFSKLEERLNYLNEKINECVSSPTNKFTYSHFISSSENFTFFIDAFKASVNDYQQPFKNANNICDVTNFFKIYYRGQSNINYYLSPSVFRSDYFFKEFGFYHEIMVRCGDKFKNSSHLEKLTLMQHYDCPTRLLDITSNPLNALYFACQKEKDKAEKDKEKDDKGKVFIFMPLKWQVNYFDSDKVLINACLPLIKKNNITFFQSNIALLYDIKFDEEFIKIYDFIGTINSLYNEIRTEKPSFEKRIDPFDLLSNHFVQPRQDNDRINKQDGAFILNGLSEDPKQSEEKLQKMVCLEIEVSNKQKILEELDAIGINEATLFPEIDKVAHYLKKTL